MLKILALSMMVGFTMGGFTMGKSAPDRVYQSDIRTLYFKTGEMTTWRRPGRRTGPIPQTQCRGCCPSMDKLPDEFQCINTGKNNADTSIRWKCTPLSDIPHNIKFSFIGVSCEGYENHDDKWILNGSCQVQYKVRDISHKTKDVSVNQSITFGGFVMFVLGVSTLLFIFETIPGSYTFIMGMLFMSLILGGEDGTYNYDSDDEYCGTYND